MTFILTKKTAVGDLKKQFASEFGGTLRIYEGRSEALEASRLIDIAATIGKVEFLGTMTVGECIAQIQENLNLKVKVYTSDNKVALPDEITLAVIKEIPAGATKTDVAKFAGEAPAAAAETEPTAAAEVAAEPVSEAVADDYPTYEECVAKYKPEEIGTAYTLSKDNKTMTLKMNFRGVLVIPDGVTAVVSKREDKYNENISAVIMPDSVASYTVKSEGVEFIRFSHNLTEISSDTFVRHEVEDLIIPEGVKVIAEGAFRGGWRIRTLSLPSTLELIMNNAFQGFGGVSLVIPANVKVIAANAFADCSSLKEVQFLNPDTIVMNNAFNAFRLCEELDIETIYAEHQIGDRTIGADKIEYLTVDGAKTIRLPKRFFGKLVVEEGTERLYAEEGGRADFREYNISKLYLPDSFDTDAIWNLPENASVIRLPDNTEEMSLSGVSEVIWPSAVKEVYISSKNIKELVVPEGVKSLKLYLDNLTKLTLPEGVESLYFDNNSLTELVVPEGVESLELDRMPNLTTLTLPSTLKKLKLRGLPLLEPFDLPKGIEELEFSYMNWEKLVVPEGVKTIRGDSNENMTELILPSTLEEIGNYAFRGQHKLESVVIPANVKHIRYNAFKGCKSLEQIVLEGNPEIEDGAFEGCPGYKKQIGDSLDSETIYFVINSEPRAIEEDDVDLIDGYDNFFAYRMVKDGEYVYGVYRWNPYDLAEELGVSADDIEIFDMYTGYDKYTNYPNENVDIFLPGWLYELCNEGFEYIDEDPIPQAIDCYRNKYSFNWSYRAVRCVLLDKERKQVAEWYLQSK